MEIGDEAVSRDVLKLSFENKSEDAADLARDISKLSPTTQANLGVLLRSISKGEALIDTDKEGRAKIEYKPSGKLFWDGSNANIIAQPKSDEDIQIKVDACLELVDYLKSQKPPSGVLLDRTKISLSPKKEYRLGVEFEKTKEVLGKGNTAGDIIVVKDKKTGQEHAHKTMMISYFRKEEIRCWVDMTDTGYVPALYLFRIENNKVSIHMEILDKAKTLRSIIDEYMEVFDSDIVGQSLKKPFSLLVLDGALEAVAKLHSKGWVHNDLHGGNVMVQKLRHDKLGVKILDFGLASQLEDCNGLNLRGFRNDICDVLRLFSGMYTGLEFNNVWDIQQNWRQGLSNVPVWRNMSKEDRKELFCLVDAAMKIVHPADTAKYRELVKKHLKNAMGDEVSEKEILKKVVALLFPEDFRPVHQPSVQHKTDFESKGKGKVCLYDMADSIGLLVSEEKLGPSESDRDLDEAARQVPDEYLDQMRKSLGICLR